LMYWFFSFLQFFCLSCRGGYFRPQVSTQIL